MKFEEVLAAIPDMSVDEMRRLQAILNFKLKPHINSKEPTNEEELLFLSFQKCMLDRGLSVPTWESVRRRAGFYNLYHKNCEVVALFLYENFQDIDQRQRTVLMNIFSRLIISHIEEQIERKRQDPEKKALDLNEMGFAICLPIVPYLVEKAFPGYLDAGMLHMLLKGYQNGRVSTESDKRRGVGVANDVVAGYTNK